MSKLKRRAAFEFLVAAIDLRAIQSAETIHPELFAAEAAHHRSVDHRAPQLGHIEVAIARVRTRGSKIADETAGEAVACSGWIEDVLQQVAGHHEVAIAAE